MPAALLFHKESNVVQFDKTRLLAARLVSHMLEHRVRAAPWIQWWDEGHFLSFVPGDEREIRAALELLALCGEVVLNPAIDMFALPGDIGKANRIGAQK